MRLLNWGWRWALCVRESEAGVAERQNRVALGHNASDKSEGFLFLSNGELENGLKTKLKVNIMRT